MSNATWTKDRIINLLKSNDRAVEKAIVAIYHRQTADEKATSDTKHTNHRGFRSNHASRGSYYARWVLSGRTLSGYHVEKAREIALHYHRQLSEIANEKEAKKNEAARSRLNRQYTEAEWAEINRQEDERERRKSNYAD